MSFVKSLFKILKNNWVYTLAGASALLFIANFLVFTPGFYSADSLSQYSQAIGVTELSNWHPITFTLTWKALIELTGSFTSMLVFQLGLLWGGIFILALLIYKITGSRKKSALALTIGLLPFVFSVSSTLWKDVHVAHSLFLASVIAAFAFFWLRVKKKSLSIKTRISLLVLIGLLLTYSAAMRHGPAVTTLPIVVLSVYTLTTSRKARLIAASIVTLAVLLMPTIISKVFNHKVTHIEYTVMLDDLVNLSNINEIRNSNLSDAEKKYIIQVQRSCYNTKHISGVWLYCERSVNKDYKQDMMAFQDTESPNLREFWINTLLKHPVRYIHYRSSAFGKLLFAERPYVWPQPWVEDNDLGVKRPKGVAVGLLKNLHNFTLLNLGFVFRGYFWLLINIAAFVVAFWKRKIIKLHPAVLAIASSGILYTLQYFPATTAYQYRYTYWSTLSAIIACIILFTELKSPLRKSKGLRKKRNA